MPTLDQVMKMTDEEVRKALLTHAGWTKIDWYEDNAGPGFWHGIPPIKLNANWEVIEQRSMPLPNVVHSLDALQPIKEGLTKEQREKFVEILSDMMGDECRMGFGFFAPAPQQSRALLAALS